MNPIAESPVSPSFLRQFKTKDTGGRDLSQKALDVIFWPFDLFSPSDDEQRDLHHEDEEDQVDDDELDEGEKRQVAGRIVALVRFQPFWSGLSCCTNCS